MASRPPSSTSPLRRRARTALLFMGAFLFLAEEWLWKRFTRFFRWLDRMPAMRWFDRGLGRLPPVVALLVLCIPIAVLFPVKIMGLWMIGSGRVLSGCLVMLAAKILSTATVARIFIGCQPQLMQMPWFARLFAWLLAARDAIHQWIRHQPAWHGARRAIRRMRAHLWAWSHGTRFDRAGQPGTPRLGALMRWRLRRKARRRRDPAKVVP